MLSRISIRRLITVAVFTAATSVLFGQAGTAVRIWSEGGENSDDEGETELTLSGTFLPSSPGATDGYKVATLESPGGWNRTDLGVVRVEPGKTYVLDVHHNRI